MPRGLPGRHQLAGRRGQWDGIRTAFAGFDPATIASLQPADAARLEADPRVIRNSVKIQATAGIARELQAILRPHGTSRKYLASFPSAPSAARDLHRRFRFLGDTGVRLLATAAQDAG